jgi:glucose-1-phosphate cytidylyltransferase
VKSFKNECDAERSLDMLVTTEKREPHVKVVLLAGGIGSRIGEETVSKPKPMIEIGNRPLLWHIMKTYGHQGFNEFVVAVGYRGAMIKKYFADYNALMGDVTVNLATGRTHTTAGVAEDWLIDLVETGESTNTGGRVRRCGRHLTDTFMLTYGDGVSDIDLKALVAYHRSHGKLCTITAVRPPARFGHLEFDGDKIVSFSEKPQLGEGWINGGYMVCEPEVLDYIDGDDVNLAHAPLENLAKDGQLMAYRHHGFWQCMDTLRDKEYLEQLWDQPIVPWRNWD